MRPTTPPGSGDMCYIKLMAGYNPGLRCWYGQVHPIRNQFLQDKLPYLAKLLSVQPREGNTVILPTFLGVTPLIMSHLISWAYNGTLYYTLDGITIKTPEWNTVIQLYALAYKINCCTLQNQVIDFFQYEFEKNGVILGLVPTLWHLTAEMSSEYHCALRNFMWDQCILMDVPVEFHQQAGYPIEFLEGLLHKMSLQSIGQYDAGKGIFQGNEKYYVVPIPQTPKPHVEFGSPKPVRSMDQALHSSEPQSNGEVVGSQERGTVIVVTPPSEDDRVRDAVEDLPIKVADTAMPIRMSNPIDSSGEKQYLVDEKPEECSVEDRVLNALAVETPISTIVSNEAPLLETDANTVDSLVEKALEKSLSADKSLTLDAVSETPNDKMLPPPMTTETTIKSPVQTIEPKHEEPHVGKNTPEHDNLDKLTGQGSEVSMDSGKKPRKAIQPYRPPHMRKTSPLETVEQNANDSKVSQSFGKTDQGPANSDHAALQRALDLFTTQFSGGYMKIKTSPEADLCGLEAMVHSIRAQHPNLEPKTYAFKDIVMSREYREIVERTLVDTEMVNENHFTADQLALIVALWGEVQGIVIQLGYITDGGIPQLVPVENSAAAVVFWIHNDDAEAAFENSGFAAKGHWSGLKPLSSSQPANILSVAKPQVSNTPSNAKTPSWCDEVEDVKSGKPVAKAPWTTKTVPSPATQVSDKDYPSLRSSSTTNKGPASKKANKKQSKITSGLDTWDLLTKLMPVHADVCPYKLLNLECPRGTQCNLKGLCGKFTQKNGCELENCKLAHVLGGCKAEMEEHKGAIAPKCRKKGPGHFDKVAHLGQGATQVEQELDWKSRRASFQLLKAHGDSVNGKWM